LLLVHAITFPDAVIDSLSDKYMLKNLELSIIFVIFADESFRLPRAATKAERATEGEGNAKVEEG
jgi:hypothetical protein